MSSVLVIAGEVSGDMRAAELVEAANALRPGLSWFGIGGPQMRSAGVHTHYDVSDMAVIGIAEVLRRYPFFKRAFKSMLALAAAENPDLALFVDYPGFNLRLAAKLHARGIRTLFYVCPQVWAWHRSRIPKMAVDLDHLITLFPFEAEHFKQTKLPVTFVGHPLVDGIHKTLNAPETPLPWSGRPRIAILPGSRTQEISRLLPIMLEAGARIEARIPDSSFIVASPGESEARQAESICRARNRPRNLSVQPGVTHETLRQADAAMVCSGTATVETALLGCPMAIAYKINPISYTLFKALLQIKNIGMVNIVAGREICPEFVQHKATPQNLAEAIEPLLTATPARIAMIADLCRVQSLMGAGGAASRAAGILVSMLPP